MIWISTKLAENRSAQSRSSGGLALPSLGFLMLVMLATGMPSESWAQPDQESQFSLEEMRQQAMALKQDLVTSTADERQQLLREIDLVVARMDQRIELVQTNLESRQAAMSSAARRYSEELMVTMMDQREDLSVALQRLETATSQSWEQMVYSFGSSYDEFFEAWDNFESQFGYQS